MDRSLQEKGFYRRLKKRKFKPNYALEEVEGLIEFYSEKTAVTNKIKWLVRFCDIDQALYRMPPKEHQAVLLLGLLSFPLDFCAKQLGVSRETVWKRYKRGIEWIMVFVNTGGENYK